MEDDAQSSDLVRAAFGAGHPVPSRPAVVILDGGGIPQQSLMRELQSLVRRHANRERARPHRHGIASTPMRMDGEHRGKCSRWNARTVVPPHDHQRNAMTAAIATTMAPLMTCNSSAVRSVMA